LEYFILLKDLREFYPEEIEKIQELVIVNDEKDMYGRSKIYL
jgi:hypothetical protein